ncbi:MAG: hypothetical protein IKU13_08735 [Clostridia bacterium]|nr:hypothetical protein [Clostridia bacterium]
MKYLLFTLLGLMPFGIGGLVLLGGDKLMFASTLLAWPLFLFLWGCIGYAVGKRQYNVKLSMVILHIPMFAVVVMAIINAIPQVIESTLIIAGLSMGFWSIIPNLILREMWFFFLFYLAVMVLCCYVGIKLAEWRE